MSNSINQNQLLTTIESKVNNSATHFILKFTQNFYQCEKYFAIK